MKKIPIFVFAALLATGANARTLDLSDRHPMALSHKGNTFERNVRKLNEEARTMLLETKTVSEGVSSGYSLEGEWKFKMYSYFLEQNMDVDFYGMLVGNTLLLESYDTYIYPLVGEFDKSSNVLTITKRYVGRDWRGRYVFVYPWVPKSNGAVEPGDIKAQYNPQTGELVFPDGVMLSWIDYADREGTENVYDEGEWYDIFHAGRSGDLQKENPDNWTDLGEATFIDGWLSPRFGIDQTRSENWLHPHLLQYKNKSYIYRLADPFNSGSLADLNDCDHPGFIEFDVRDPNHVVLNRIDAGWTCSEIGIYKFYAYNMIGYYMEDLRESGENWETAQQFLMAYNNPDLPYTTFKDNVVDFGAILYAGELVYDANFGDSTYPEGGNTWIRFNMKSKIYFPGTEVNEPQINFDGTPSVEFDSDNGCADISLDFIAENLPEESYIFVMVTDNQTGANVARKYVKTGTHCSFTLDNVTADDEFTMVVRIEGNLSEALSNSLPFVFNLKDNPKEMRTTGIDTVGNGDQRPIYYNLQGVKVEQPRKGELYIRVNGDKVTKIIF